MLSLLEAASPDQLQAYKTFLFGQMRVEINEDTAQRVGIERGPDGRISYLDGVLKHPGQRQIHFPTEEEEWRYHVACWGRRAAKTISAAAEATFEMGMRKRRIWIVAPTYKLTDRVFEWVFEWVVRQSLFGPKSVEKAHYTKDRRYIEMKESVGGSFIEGMSGEAPDSCLGEQLNLQIIDEAARLPQNLWLQNLEPTTVDRQGRTIFISTPQGDTWFKDYFERGQEEATRAKGWRSSRVCSWDNPFVPKPWLESKREETPEPIWLQEYGASFEQMSGRVWPEFVAKIWPEGHLFDPNEVDLSYMTHYRAVDIGFNLPTGCVWGAVDKDTNDVYVYQDYEETCPSHDDHAEAITALTTYPIQSTWISPDSRRKTGLRALVDDSPWKIYRDAGIYARLAHDDVRPGINTVSRYIRAALVKDSSHPKLLISNRCTKLIKRIESYVMDEVQNRTNRDQPDKPRKYMDHLPDALRYLLATRPRFITPKLGTVVDRYGYEGTPYAREHASLQKPRMRGVPGLAQVVMP